MSLENTIPRHVPVLPEEVVRGLEPLEGCLAVDLTVGGGGHTEDSEIWALMEDVQQPHPR